MKKISILLFLLAAFGLYACTQDEAFVDGTPSKGLTAEIPSYEFEGNSTRVNISENLSTYTWENGDKIGIYYTSGTTYADAIFTLKQGGSSHGEFYNEAFSLKPNITYYAFYPYAYNATVDAYPVDFTGQVQTANGSTAHIGSRNYMSAEVNTNANGAANIVFQNQTSVIQLTLPIEKADTYTGVTLSTADADFITKGTLNMKTDSIISTSKSREIKVTFDQGISMSKGGTLTVNLLVAPVDLSGKTFSVAFETEAETYLFENLEGMSIQKGKAYKVNCGSGMIVEIPYLTFTAEAEQTLRMSKAVETLEYSVNGGEWEELGTNTVFFGGENGKLRLRGKSSRGTANNSFSDYSSISFENSVEIACSGDIRTLVDFENYKTVNTNGARFCHLFEGCTSLIAAPRLPAITLAESCYYGMFRDCTSLVTAPKLPAITIASHCYNGMFQGCTSLTGAPKLSATTLAYGCYYGMFRDCNNLTISPELPATNLAGYCYCGMFQGCINLSTAPELPATKLAEYCYECMFQGCNSLITSPELPATSLAKDCYTGMFSGCTSLTTVPKLPATTLANRCYTGMFSGCTSLTTVPKLPATTLAASCYSGMFSGCTSLTTVPDLPATTLAPECYLSMFSQCTSLTKAPKLPATTLAERCYASMFSGCTSLTTVPKLPATTLAASCYSGMFSGCTNLIAAPQLLATTLVQYCYESMFSDCTSLTTVYDLPATNLAYRCCESMFSGCTSLTTVPKLPATTLAESCYVRMFQRCTSLTAVPKLPATTLAPSCYSGMFSGCTSLITAPQLPATTLAKNCYSVMFYECTSLTTAPDLPAIALVENCYHQMFLGCIKLNYIKMMAKYISAYNCLSNWTYDVSSTGTFVKNTAATWDVRGYDGIPTDWTVEEAKL